MAILCKFFIQEANSNGSIYLSKDKSECVEYERLFPIEYMNVNADIEYPSSYVMEAILGNALKEKVMILDGDILNFEWLLYGTESGKYFLSSSDELSYLLRTELPLVL